MLQAVRQLRCQDLDIARVEMDVGIPARVDVAQTAVDDLRPVQDRDVVGVADAFGESFLYYWNRNPATNQWQRKVTFVKRVTSFGVPVLIGAGYYLESEGPN